MKIIVMMLIALSISGCGSGVGGTNALMDEERLADEAWCTYVINFYVIIDSEGKIEEAYKQGFRTGFQDLYSNDYSMKSEDEHSAYEIGYADGVWNRTGDF